MLDPQELSRLLNFIQEPIFVVSGTGKVEMANLAAYTHLGEAAEGHHLSAFATTPSDELASFFRRCAGSGSPTIGSISLRGSNGGTQRFQVKGALLSKGSNGARIILRCNAAGLRDFTQLSSQVASLNEENRKLRRIRAVLEELLSQRELLLRELQHRVRNQTQMMLGMVASAQRDAAGGELTVFLDALRSRLLALGAVQQLMYTAENLDAISATELIEQLCRSTASSWPDGAEVSVACVPTTIRNDVAAPLALILNELLSNALKHGLKFEQGQVQVELVQDQEDLILTVADPGSGFATAETGRAASGLTLVRGLCRQIGGAFAVSTNGVTRCTVRFPQSGD